MRKRILAITGALAATVTVAACGSKAPGVQLAPSSGATAASVPTTPTPPPQLQSKPTVTPPKNCANNQLITRDLIPGTGQAAQAATGERPVEALVGIVAHLLGAEHAAGACDPRDAAGEVDGVPVEVAGPEGRLAARDARARSGKVGFADRLDQRQRRLDQRTRLAAHQHRGVADRLHQPDVALGDLGRKLGEPADDAAELLGLDLAAEPGEPDQVYEAHRP